MIERILKAIDLLAWDNVGKCNAETAMPVADLEILRRHVIALQNENKSLKKDNLELRDKMLFQRERLIELNERLCMPKFNDYKRMF